MFIYTKQIVLIVLFHNIIVNWSDFVGKLIQIIKLLVIPLKVAQISSIEYLRAHLGHKKLIKKKKNL